MTSRALLDATLQQALLGAASNVLAQLITASKNKTELSVDWIPVFQFLLFSIISTPPNFLWQVYLESTYPAHPPAAPAPHAKKSDTAKRPPSQPAPLSIRNTVAKFALDQTVGAVVNTLLFSVFIHSLQDAMAPAPRITSLPKAAAYWTTPGAIDLARVRFADVWAVSLADFWPIVMAGLKVWPAVSLLNFTVIKTVPARNLVGALVGVAWGIYMSMVAAK
ncbi:peroxisomal protein [Hirsutella rhossiliensis]|uniref:Mpv17 / PMP22 family domain-containing protein n=1 Tax=Hirsutella rhossiliensis TaxID=111463 RepID=A0A9P8SKE7_9HYPO|nr:mpv17 / PMP22 family domain-containing protein [Hirsutella rhossiliensis]KAH0964056.1 mpv17 / PMP22 family domain-containing protein [Hirsutella rhossiliensis]